MLHFALPWSAVRRVHSFRKRNPPYEKKTPKMFFFGGAKTVHHNADTYISANIMISVRRENYGVWKIAI